MAADNRRERHDYRSGFLGDSKPQNAAIDAQTLPPSRDTHHQGLFRARAGPKLHTASDEHCELKALGRDAIWTPYKKISPRGKALDGRAARRSLSSRGPSSWFAIRSIFRVQQEGSGGWGGANTRGAAGVPFSQASSRRMPTLKASTATADECLKRELVR